MATNESSNLERNAILRRLPIRTW